MKAHQKAKERECVCHEETLLSLIRAHAPYFPLPTTFSFHMKVYISAVACNTLRSIEVNIEQCDQSILDEETLLKHLQQHQLAMTLGGKMNQKIPKRIHLRNSNLIKMCTAHSLFNSTDEFDE